MNYDTISRADVIKIIKSVLSPASSLINVARARRQMLDRINELESKPEPHWIPVTKEEMFKAGYDGREIIFKVDGRLFAIRELAQ